MVKANNRVMVYANGAILNPSTPYQGSVPKLNSGDMIVINGFVQPKSKWFAIGLKNNRDGHKVDTILQINPRFEKKEVIRNTLIDSQWGQEEKHNGLGHLRSGKHFECMILVLQKCYKIAFNGSHLADYMHRLPFEDINFVSIEGEIILNSINVQHAVGSKDRKTTAMPAVHKFAEGSPKGRGSGGSTMPALPGGYDLEVPYLVLIPGGLSAGRVIFMSIIPDRYCRSFSLTMKSGPYDDSNIGFQFVANFDDDVVRCNSRVKNTMGKEIKVEGNFPFKKGVHSDILLKSTDNGLQLSVNNKHYVQFPHRLPDVENIIVMQVKGDISLVHVRMV